ncbi:hypothetical protein [Kitasatospora sp. MAA19]|uniref:hypothetical protein n=1 Tax=Kitasatospora sp. MAA19 TaxID=3035090 RepID=UPI002473E30F|nr:hypothetical protein [Kitasatospora sp. MAA19]
MTDELTVAVDGHLEPVTAPPLEALETLWQAVCALPISDYERRAMQRLLGSGTTDDLERRMNGDETTDWPLTLDGDSLVIVRVSYGDGLTYRQRVAARYTVVQLPADQRGRRPWVIRDAETGGLVTAGTGPRPLEFSIRESADEWTRGRVNLAGYRAFPIRTVAE